MTNPVDRIGAAFPEHLTNSHVGLQKVGRVQTTAHYGAQNYDRQPRPKDAVSVPETIELDAGDILFDEGDPSGHAYFVESGALEVFVFRAQENQIIGQVKVGEILGEMGVIDNKPRSTAAKAISPSRVRLIPAERIASMLESTDPGMQALIHTLLDRLRETTTRLAEAEARY